MYIYMYKYSDVACREFAIGTSYTLEMSLGGGDFGQVCSHTTIYVYEALSY
jgi:hypothetical protein